MARHAIFGRPAGDLSAGGAILTVHVVPVYGANLAAFDLDAAPVTGRWLPWTTMNYGENPYETASAIVDDWCQGAVRDLRLVDVLSLQIDPGAWEVAIVFRAELSAPPESSPGKTAVLVRPSEADRIGPFLGVDLQRWMGSASQAEAGPKLLF